MSNQDPQRLRTPPEQRFVAPQHPFNLATVTAKLRQESRAGPIGHRQETLYKHGSTSVALFLFEPLAHFPPHRAKGVVTIHVLKGHLQITAEGQIHHLHANSLLILAPGVEHDLVAQKESEMLLTVQLQTL